MKTLFLLATLLLTLALNAQKYLTMNELQLNENIFFVKTSGIPFSGKLATLYPNGELESINYIKKGKKTGKMELFYDSGKRRAILFENEDHLNYGKFKAWHEDGTLSFKGKFGEGRLLEKGEAVPFTGKTLYKYKNGDVFEEDNFIDGYWNGKQTRWNREGEIIFECVYKNNQLIDCPIFNKE